MPNSNDFEYYIGFKVLQASKSIKTLNPFKSLKFLVSLKSLKIFFKVTEIKDLKYFKMLGDSTGNTESRECEKKEFPSFEGCRECENSCQYM